MRGTLLGVDLSNFHLERAVALLGNDFSKLRGNFQVFGTAYLASYYFTKNPPNGKLYVMGNSGIQGELANVKGLEIVTEETGKFG